MATRTAIAQSRAEAYKQPRNDCRNHIDGVAARKQGGLHEGQDPSGPDKSPKEKQPIHAIFGVGLERPANKTTDACNATIKKQQQRRCRANQCAANQSRERGKLRHDAAQRSSSRANGPSDWTGQGGAGMKQGAFQG